MEVLLRGPHCGGAFTRTALWRYLYKYRTVEVLLQGPYCGGIFTRTALWRYLYKDRTVEVSLQGPHCGGIVEISVFALTGLWVLTVCDCWAVVCVVGLFVRQDGLSCKE